MDSPPDPPTAPDLREGRQAVPGPVRDRLLMILFVAQVATIAGASLLFLLATRDARVGFFWFSFIAGVLGASLALLRRVQRDEVVVRDNTGSLWITVWMALLYGGLMAGVAYMLFASEILSGEGGDGFVTTNLFPLFQTEEGVRPDVADWIGTRPASLRDAGKLIVWCIVAGYSEGFVTGILKRLDQTSVPVP